MEREASHEAGDETVGFDLKTFVRPAHSFVSRVLSQLADNLLACVLLSIMFGVLWYALEIAIPAHDKRVLDEFAAHQVRTIEAIKLIQEKASREQRYMLDAFAQERQRDRERAKEQEEWLREIRDWFRRADAGRGLNNLQPLARPAG